LRYGIAAVMTSLDALVARQTALVKNVIQEIDFFTTRRQLVCLFVMATFEGARGIERQLLAYLPDGANGSMEKLVRILSSAPDFQFEQTSFPSFDGQRVSCFLQRNNKLSRKQLQPFLDRELRF